MKAVLTRCVTIYDQWEYLGKWVDNSDLYDSEIEWLVINDNPKVPCPEDLLGRLEERGMRLIQLTFNRGRASARNHGGRLATGTWLEFIDGDDIPLPIAVSELKEGRGMRLHHYPNLVYEMRDGLPVVREIENVSEFGYPGLFTRFTEVNCRPSALVYLREMFLEVGGFDGRYDTIEDMHLLRKLEAHGVEIQEHSSPKQMYQRDGKSRVLDWESTNLHKARFFRDVVRQEVWGSQKETGVLKDYAETYMLKVVIMIFQDLKNEVHRQVYVHPDYLKPHLVRLMEVSYTLFNLVKELHLRATKAGFAVRLRESIKILFAR